MIVSLYITVASGLAHAVARIATGLLHLVGVDAVREGCCIVYRGRCMVVASECSGIRSLCAITATMLLGGMLWRYGAARTAMIVIVGALMAVVCNIVRVAACVLSPAIHDLTGYVAYGAALVGTLVIDSMMVTPRLAAGGSPSQEGV